MAKATVHTGSLTADEIAAAAEAEQGAVRIELANVPPAAEVAAAVKKAARKKTGS